MLTGLMGRRQFGKIFGRLVAYPLVGAAHFESEQIGEDTISTFIRLGQMTSPQEAAAYFAQADSATLMATYAVFFPALLHRHGDDAVELLQHAANEQKKISSANSHRMDAMPAVAAAHWLAAERDEHVRYKLSQKIIESLKDERREPREIILQNLVSSLSANFDTVLHHTTDPRIVRQTVEIIHEASDNEKLLSPALLSAEFLLNSRALLVARNAPEKELQPYNSAIGSIKKLKAPHLWYLPTLIKHHELTFKASMRDIRSLPPQSSEALMGWEFSKSSRDYSTLLAITRARMIYHIWYTASGKLKSDSVMSTEQASAALPQIIAFFRAFHLGQLLGSSRGLSMVESAATHDRSFGRFLRLEFGQLMASPERFGVPLEQGYISPKLMKLKEHVPFKQYDDRHLLTRALREKNERFRKGILEAAGAVITAEVLSTMIDTAIGWLSGRDEPNNILKPSNIEEVKSRIDAQEAAIDEGKYKGLEQQQSTLGSIDTGQFAAGPKS